MKKKKFVVKNMTRQDLDIAVEWAAQEGWNPGLHDADCFYSTDSHGYFMGFLNDEPISCISAVSYNDSFGFLGFYITKQEYRGQGYGIRVWKKAIEYLKTQNIGLDGVVAQQENYKKSGFKLAYSNIRYEDEAKRADIKVVTHSNLSNIPFEDLLTYDNQCFPVPRSQFLKCWISMPESYGTASVVDNQLKGYGVIRKCRKGYKVGPLFADDEVIAKELYQNLCNQIEEGMKVYLDVPEFNRSAIHLVEQFGMTKVFGTARMYTKNQPEIELNKVFGVTTFELG